jgi:SWI/SNF-related matrix-associated actin-dependent regulator 1 of chromatin subfamily A
MNETNAVTTSIKIEELCDWSPAKEVQTQYGARLLRKAIPAENGPFWQAWRTNKDALKAAGLSCKPAWNQPGVWEACWWQPLPAEQVTERNATAAASRAIDADISVPAPEGLAYMPFQRGGIDWAIKHPNTIIGDEMGLGKTIQAIGLINSDNGIRSILVVAPKTAIGNWRRELNKWLVDKSRTIGIATGGTFPTSDIVLINWDVLTKWPKRLTNYWDLIILDEAQFMKNWKTKRAQAVIGLKPSKRQRAQGIEPTSPLNARRKLVLTGTPIENRADELWPLLHFLDHAKWPSYWKFTQRYCGVSQFQVSYKPIQTRVFGGGVRQPNDLVTKTATRTVTQIGDGQNLEKLNRVLREEGWLIRRLKKDVLTELPAKTRVIVEVEPDEACLAALDREHEASEEWEEALEDAEAEMELAKASGDKATFEEAVKALATCKRIPFDEIARVRHDTAVAKLQQCMAMLDERIEAKGPKIIVFGHHKDVLHPLHERYPNSVILTGETPSDERDRIVHRFQTDPTCGPFIGSIRACGFAITLTAASHAVFVEEDWTPGKISQAEDRAHRIGQKDNVLVEHFILPGSIDAKMAKTHVRKQAIADAALDEVQAMLVKSEVSLGVESAGTTITFAQMSKEAEAMAPELVAKIHEGLRIIAGVCDGARQRDDNGFNGCDTKIGKSLAMQMGLSARQAVLGKKILLKYHRQLPDYINEAIREKASV